MSKKESKTTKTVKAKKVAKATFKSKVLKRMNKDEKTIQNEELSDKIEDFVLDCQTQISMLETSAIPGKENELTRAKRVVDRAEKDLANADYNMDEDSYADYVGTKNSLGRDLSTANSVVEGLEADIEGLKRDLEVHKDNLAIFKS